MLVPRHLEGNRGRPQIERRRLNRDQHQSRGAYGHLRLGFGMRRAIDHDEIGAARPILYPLRRAPTGERCEIEAGDVNSEPRAPQIDPRSQAPLWVDIEHGESETLL